MRIYKDEAHDESEADTMFHSFICPSVASEFDGKDSLYGYYAFNYFCFGSDAQAIKLSFFNKSPNYDRKYKVITYYANGGTFSYFSGMKLIN